jgi:hypothetical protein
MIQDMVTKGDDERAPTKEEVPEISTSGSYQEIQTIRTAVESSQQPAQVDFIELKTPKTKNAPKVPQEKPPALDTGDHKVLASSKLNYTIQACLERETSEFAF